jgi:uncharacterized membrane protein YhaH (DUF805 family)
MNVDIPNLYLAIQGRIGRRDFWIGAVGLIIVVIALAAILGWVLGALRGNLATALILAYPTYALIAKRLQDRNHPGAYAAIPVGFSILSPLLGVLGLTGTPAAPNLFGVFLGLIAFVIGLWIVMVCGFGRGTAGDNRFGADPFRAAASTEARARTMIDNLLHDDHRHDNS